MGMKKVLGGFCAWFLIIGTMAVHAAALPVNDPDFGCVSQADATRYVRDFQINSKSFGGMELCKSQSDLKKLFNDFLLIEKGEFSSSDPNLLIRDFIQPDQYYSWMRSQTRGIRRGNDIPFATAYNQGGYFTFQDGWAKLSTLGRVGTVIHEARHTEGYSHMPCNHGPYEGANTDACDRDYGYGGSHAIEMEYYARVAVQGRNFHPVYQSMARLMAMGRTNFVFNASPIRPREVLTVIDQDSKPWILDDEQVLARSGVGEMGGTLKRASHGASLFFGGRTLTLDLYQMIGSEVAIQDDYSYFKLPLLDRGQGAAPLKDLEEVDLKTRRFAVGLKLDGTTGSYDFARGKWSSFAQPISGAERFITTLPTGEKGIFLRTTDGTLMPFDPLTLKYRAPLANKWPSEFESAAIVNGKVHALDAEGSVLFNNGSGWTAVPAFREKRITQMVSSPVYDAFVVAQ